MWKELSSSSICKDAGYNWVYVVPKRTNVQVISAEGTER